MLHDDDRGGSQFEPIGPNDDGWPSTTIDDNGDSVMWDAVDLHDGDPS